MSSNAKHNDCRKFIAVDVAKGICSLTNEIVMIDSQVCPEFVLTKKCKNCNHFTMDKEKTMGICIGFAEPDWAYEDLIAENCEMYKLRHKVE